MDTSETYIKMCERAEEIQVIVKPPITVSNAFKNGDWASVGKTTPYCLNDIPWANAVNREDIIWLPRQDQLQGLLKDIYKDSVHLIDNFYLWYRQLEEKFINDTSIEQLWLAFVMKERYSKIWNGDDWIKA